MNVKDIRYSQDTISDTFSDGTSLKCTVDMLKIGKIKPENIKPIRVGKYNGHYRTIDNRRLYCFKQSNIKKIKVKYIHNIGNLADFRDKYTSNNGGTSIRIRKELIDTFFYCDVCYRNMQLSNKISHLNGRRHHKNLQNQNIDNSIKNKKLNCIRDEVIVEWGWKPINKNTTVTHTKSTKIVNNNNKNIKKYKQTVNTNILRVKNQNTDNSIKNKKLNCIGDYSDEGIIACGLKSDEGIIAVSVSQNIKELGSNANNKGIYDVKVRIEPVISYKPKTNNGLRLAAVRSGDNGISVSQNIKAVGSNANNKCFERIYLQLEQVIRAKTQQVNAYKIKCALMQQQIHNYEIKLRKMEQANIAIDVDDIDFDLERKKEYVL